MATITRLALVLMVLGSTACASAHLVAVKAADDMSCPAKDIEVVSREMGAYEAKGCGKKMSYVVRAGEVMADDGNDLGDSHHD
jgi:hypothetical protein